MAVPTGKAPPTRIIRKGPPPPGSDATALDAPPDPLSDPTNREKVEIAKEFAFHLAKGIKNIGIYRHNTAKYPEFLQKALESLGRFTETHGPLSLRVESECFSLYKEPVFQAESAQDNLPYKFYRDGIRQLIFRPELTSEELVKFVLIALSDPQRGGEDILAQLWKANLEHIEYVVVEGFSIGEMSEEQVQVQVDQVVNYLYTRLRSHSNDFLRFARLRAEDLDAKLEGVDQIRGAVVTGTTATDGYKQKIQEQLRDDETKLFGKVVQTIFNTLDSGTLGDFEALKDLFAQILDALLLQEDFDTVVHILRKLRSLTEEDAEHAAVARPLADYWTSKMGEEQRLRQLGETLKTGKPKEPALLREYLVALDSRAIVPILEVLDTLEIADNRQILVEALVELGKEFPEPFVNRLTSEKSQMVRDMIAVIERCDFKDKVKFFGKALENRNPAVRLEVLTMLSKSRTEQARKFVAAALEDASPQVAIHAAKSLARNAPERALTEVMRIVKAPEFEKRELKEREGFYSALGLTQLPGAFALFGEILKQKKLLGGRKLLEQKICACAGLGGIASVHSYKALQAIHEDKSNDEELLTAARKAMFQVRKLMEAAKASVPGD